jgi:thiamine biosynthesis lipoprotein
MTLSRLTLLLAAAGLASMGSVQTPQRPFHHQATRMSMACAYAIDAYGLDAETLPRVLEDALDEVDRIDRLMSHYKADSPLSRLNREAAQAPVQVDQELFDFIVDSMRYYRDSHGAFDITVGPLMKAWGFFNGEGRVPTAGDLEEARRHVGGNHVILNAADRTIRFDQPGVELDLGGIAKGYAVDRVVRLLKDRGVRAALVSAGGSTTYGLGTPPGSEGWEVTIQDPVNPQNNALTVLLNDRALSVSGSYGKWFESGGVRYSHIMDPRSGMPVQGMLSVAVMTATGTAGDALDDAFFVLGPEGSRPYLNEVPGTEVYYFVAHPTQPWRLIHARAR